MKPDEVEDFEKLQSQIAQFHAEVSLLSKSKPDNALNVFKLKLINQKVAEANELLSDKYKPFSDFDQFDEEALPTNSDVVFILAQYLECLETWRCTHISRDSVGNWYWNLAGGHVMRAHAPRRSVRDRPRK